MQDIPTKSKESERFPDLDFHSCFTKKHSSRIFKKDLSFFFLQSSTSPSHSTTQFRLHSSTPKSSDFQGNVCRVQRQWKLMVAVLIPMKANLQEDQIILAQRSLMRKKSLLTMLR